jgi:large subunit ribosomal protein L31
MQSSIHPEYGPVVFRDRSTGRTYLTRSTLAARATERTIELDGATYPLLDVDVTADSHPFWTGTTRTLDSEGRVEAFERRYGRRGAGSGGRRWSS